MSGTKNSSQAETALNTALRMAAQLPPLARSTSDAAKRGVTRTRAWAAPQLERGGQVLQDQVAPKVSAALSSAAQHVDPGQPKPRQWRKVAAFSLLAAAVNDGVAPGQVPFRGERGGGLPPQDGVAICGTKQASGGDGRQRKVMARQCVMLIRQPLRRQLAGCPESGGG